MIKFELVLLLRFFILGTAFSFSSLPVVQLWLDLSGTAINSLESLPPRTFPDKVILSLKTGSDLGQATLENDTMHSAKHIETELDGESKIIYQTELSHEDKMKKFALFENDVDPFIGKEESCYGYILSFSDDLKESTLAAVDIISSGKWVILESNGNVKRSLISDLVNLIIPFVLAQSNLPGLLGGALSKKRGGLGLKCKTTSDVVTMGSLLQSSISLSSGSMDATNEGIIWQTTDGTKEPAIDIALVLPFDYEIWAATLGIRY
jgi:hypothetical protein